MTNPIYAALALVLTTVTFAADHPDFTGTWKIDASKMDTSKGAPPLILRKVTREGNFLTMTEVQSRDGKKTAIIRKFSTDASDVSGTLNGQPVTSRGMWEGDKLVSDTTIADKITIHDVWSLSDDGKTWIDDIVFDGRPATWVFTRQYLP